MLKMFTYVTYDYITVHIICNTIPNNNMPKQMISYVVGFFFNMSHFLLLHMDILFDISETVISMPCNSFTHVSRIYGPQKPMSVSSCSCDSYHLRFSPRNG